MFLLALIIAPFVFALAAIVAPSRDIFSFIGGVYS